MSFNVVRLFFNEYVERTAAKAVRFYLCFCLRFCLRFCLCFSDGIYILFYDICLYLQELSLYITMPLSQTKNFTAAGIRPDVHLFLAVSGRIDCTMIK